jgi:hypothetical protein
MQDLLDIKLRLGWLKHGPTKRKTMYHATLVTIVELVIILRWSGRLQPRLVAGLLVDLVAPMQNMEEQIF